MELIILKTLLSENDVFVQTVLKGVLYSSLYFWCYDGCEELVESYVGSDITHFPTSYFLLTFTTPFPKQTMLMKLSKAGREYESLFVSYWSHCCKAMETLSNLQLCYMNNEIHIHNDLPLFTNFSYTNQWQQLKPNIDHPPEIHYLWYLLTHKHTHSSITHIRNSLQHYTPSFLTRLNKQKQQQYLDTCESILHSSYDGKTPTQIQQSFIIPKINMFYCSLFFLHNHLPTKFSSILTNNLSPNIHTRYTPLQTQTHIHNLIK